LTINDAMEVLRQHSTSKYGDAPFPHCDMYVLHAPDTCTTCDNYPIYQALRVAWGINFTNTHVDLELPCPATIRRDESVINLWPGNQPHREWLRG
jgi:hypothetical protein